MWAAFAAFDAVIGKHQRHRGADVVRPIHHWIHKAAGMNQLVAFIQQRIRHVIDGSGPPTETYGIEAKFTCANAFGTRGTLAAAPPNSRRRLTGELQK
jgi:hypothetical protein